jgi:hypothetical protein
LARGRCERDCFLPSVAARGRNRLDVVFAQKSLTAGWLLYKPIDYRMIIPETHSFELGRFLRNNFAVVVAKVDSNYSAGILDRRVAALSTSEENQHASDKWRPIKNRGSSYFGE